MEHPPPTARNLLPPRFYPPLGLTERLARIYTPGYTLFWGAGFAKGRCIGTNRHAARLFHYASTQFCRPTPPPLEEHALWMHFIRACYGRYGCAIEETIEDLASHFH